MFDALKSLAPKRDNSNYDRVASAFEERRAQARAEYESQLADLEAEESAASAAAFDQDREADPAFQEHRRLMLVQSQARQRAAERLAVLPRLLDAEIKRKAPARGDVAAAHASLSAHPEEALSSLLKKE